MIKVYSVLFLSTKMKIIYFAHHCRFFPTRLYFPILLFSPLEHLFKTAITFAITVSICYINEFLKTKLTKNSVFLFFALAVCLQFVSQLFRNLQNSRGDKEPILDE